MGIMELGMGSCKDCSWWVVALPALLGSNTIFSTHFLFISLLLTFVSAILLTWVLSPGGGAWSHSRSRRGSTPIPGPRGLPLFGSLFTLSRGLPHRSLASLARAHGATQLMAFSIGATPAVVSCDAGVAREVLTHACFADRPLKASARELMFARAIGFAPSGAYWRLLRRIASTHLFAPRLLQTFSPNLQADSQAMLQAIAAEQAEFGAVQLRHHLQHAALNNIMGCVFGKRYDVSRDDADAEQLKSMVREGFELLGAFNWSDHLPWLTALYDPSNLRQRCAKLVPRVRAFIKAIIDKHNKPKTNGGDDSHSADFVDVLLSLEGEEKLADDDMIAVLWEMIFRGTDTVALLTEWAMAELVLNPVVQAKLRAEVDSVGRVPTDSDVAKLPYLNAVIKETLRSHPPGPLLSWARLSTDDVQLRNGMVVPAGTTAMVNMWAITHDPAVWAHPDEFRPERFLDGGEGADVDVRGGDLRLAPFGAGRRVCPGKSLGIVTAALWLARLVYYFEWAPADASPVLLDELLKLSCEMKSPLVAVAIPRKEDGEH